MTTNREVISLTIFPKTLLRGRHCLSLALACALLGTFDARAADIVVRPTTGSGFIVKDATGTNERLRVQESGAVSMPSVVGAAAQSQALCISTSGSNSGLLGPCDRGGGSIFTAGTGLVLAGSTFSVAPAYQLPQGCAANQIAQWNGTAWGCGNPGGSGGTYPVGTTNQTLRYNDSNALVTNNLLQALSDGGLVAGGALGTGGIPATGDGTRMMWYPAKAAFRAGVAEFGSWDDANVGAYSFAAGRGTTAKGDYSNALGEFSNAEGQYSMALGNTSKATGIASFAAGRGASATGDYAIAMGYFSQARMEGATALGEGPIAAGQYSTAMGYHSVANDLASVAMGNQSDARLGSAAIGWLVSATGSGSTALGNSTQASGTGATALGYATEAKDDYSTAMGSRASTNGHIGSFVYGDGAGSRVAVASNTADNQFMVAASGGSIFYSNVALTTGVSLLPGSGSWTALSDRDQKTAVVPVDGRDVLKKVAALPMNTWQYKAQESKYRHMGPMAQDFYAAFRLGETNTGIDTVDADGVALAAIQGLNSILEEKEREISNLRAELEIQKSRTGALESMARDFADMRAQIASLREASSPQPKIVLTSQH